MRVMVTGASGLLGSYLFRHFKKSSEAIQGTHFNNPTPGTTQIDLLKFSEVDALLKELRPELILHCAAEDKPDECELNPERTREINLEATRHLLHRSKETNAKFVFYSTDYVFDGRIGPYRESDAPAPVNEYGRQKLSAEQLIKDAYGNYIIMRLALIYGVDPHHRGYLVRFVRNLTNGVTVETPIDLLGTPVYARQIADVTGALVDKDARGLFHVGGREFISRYDFCNKVTDVFHLDRRYLKPIHMRQMDRAAQRPLNGGLVCSNVEKASEIKMLPASPGLQQLKDDLKAKGWEILTGPLN
jgi:dTDP-4-dehydrorhamnose reductase